MSSVEIEDVLSSIRRLVSEDLRPMARSAPRSEKVGAQVAAQVAARAEPKGGKLILTPALRVVAETEASGIGQVVASVSAAVGAQSDEWESETGDDEGPQPKANVDWFVMAEKEERDADAVAEATADVVSDEAEAVPGWAQQEAAEGAEDAEAGGAQEVLAGTLEPDQDWADAAEARVIAELEDEVLEAAMPPDAGAEADDGALYEEQVLRGLVRDIIRDELQSGLGERITRNIRKLVRAEIARALATQALD